MTDQNKLNCPDDGMELDPEPAPLNLDWDTSSGSFLKSSTSRGRYLGWCSAAAGWNIGTTMRVPAVFGLP